MIWPLRDIVLGTKANAVFLTFDDGPDELVTPGVLDLLRTHEIRATFFLVGEKVERAPGLVSRIQEEGHTIGNHSYSHASLLARSRAFLAAELQKTDDAIERITGDRPVLFRPPYGRFGLALLRELKYRGQKLVLWNASVRDYKIGSEAGSIQQRLLRKARPGRIVLLHDGHANGGHTLRALQNTLPRLLDGRLQFSALPKNGVF